MNCNAKVEITPKMLAEAFWEMESTTQVKFFEELHNVISADYKTNSSAYSLGEMQWLYMGEELNKNPKAKEMACAMLAWVFNHSTNYLERNL